MFSRFTPLHDEVLYKAGGGGRLQEVTARRHRAFVTGFGDKVEGELAVAGTFPETPVAFVELSKS